MLAHRRTGGLPLVLLHALPLDGTMFDGVREALPHRDILTFDAPGFGGSPSGAEVARAFGDGQPSLDAYARAVLADLDGLGVDRFFVAGLSMGGPVAAALAEFAPHRVLGLGLLDTNIGADTDEARAGRLAKAEAAEAGDISSAEEMAETMTSETTKESRPETYRALQDRLRAVRGPSLAWIQRAMAARPDRRGIVDRAQIPILALRGDEDRSCTAETIADLVRCNPERVESVTIDGAGHFTSLEDPAAVAGALDRLLARSVPGEETDRDGTAGE